jgi:hypothetical protein
MSVASSERAPRTSALIHKRGPGSPISSQLAEGSRVGTVAKTTLRDLRHTFGTSAARDGIPPGSYSRAMASTEDAVRRYYEVVADLSSSRDDLLALLHPEVRVVEHPNAIAPAGAEHDLEGVLAGFDAGKNLLSRQEFVVHEVIVSGQRAAVRATWRGTVARDAGRFSSGDELEAEVAGFLILREGRVLAQETFDCYMRFGGD